MLLNLRGWNENQNKKLTYSLRQNIKRIIKGILKDPNATGFSFLEKKNNNLLFKNINLYKKFFLKKKNLLIIGTGGSSLGSKALFEVAGIDNVYYLENIDPVYINKTLNRIPKTGIGIIVISKSGETAETLIIFSILMNLYKKIINFKKDCLLITEKKKSILLNIAKQNKIKYIEHEKDIGGRYSCFSIAGLFPLAARGLNEGQIKTLSDVVYLENLIENKYNNLESLTTLVGLLKNKIYKGHVVLAYHESMKSLVLWYRQLWAESLGKENKGLHFIHGSGAVDQHSQLQMWLDGPNNLIFTIIIPKKRKLEFVITDIYDNLPKNFKNKKIGDILNTMAEATAQELRKAGRKVRVIYLDDDSLDSTVKLMATLMLEVSILCKANNINPFNQPAVEKVKLRTKKLLNKYV